MRLIFLTALLTVSFPIFSYTDETYEFKGKHFLASYTECDCDALINLPGLKEAMNRSVEASGATILSSNSYEFEGNGLTMVFLLQESHASIHTYPEHGACFIDLFTCGDCCSYERFQETLSSYLKPLHVHQKVFIRHQDMDEIIDIP